MSLRFRTSPTGRPIWMRLSRCLPTLALTEAAAKYIARAMVYDDVIRVAGLKTQPARADRIQREMGGAIVATTEFMHPRMAELLGLLPPGLGDGAGTASAAGRLAGSRVLRPAAHPDRSDRWLSAALLGRRAAWLAAPHLAPRSGMAPDRGLAGVGAGRARTLPWPLNCWPTSG